MPKLKPHNFLQIAIKAYREQHGATEMGSYRDAVTDLLHLAFNDKKLRKQFLSHDRGIQDNPNWDSYIKNELAWGAYDVFEEERELTENRLVQDIPAEDLPLHINDEWEFESTRHYFEEKLKHGK